MCKYIWITMFLSFGMFLDVTSLKAASSTKKIRIKPVFAIYAAEIKGKGLSKAKLLEPPLLTAKDIIYYEWINQSIKITPEATIRLSQKLKPTTSGIPFIVVVRGKRCYKGAFWWSISSIASFEPVILADNLMTAKRGATLRFQEGYPAGIRWKASGRILTEKEKIPAYNKPVRDTLMRLRKLTENGLVIMPGGYTFPYRPGKYRTRMTNENQAKSDAAYKKIYHRYGRENYNSLRKKLLAMESNFTSPGEFIASIRIFHEANDKKALIKAIEQLNPKVIRDSLTWNKIDEQVHTDGIEVYQAFIMACAPKIYSPGYFGSYQNKYIKLLNSGKAGKAEKVTVEKMIDMKPKLFARFCKLLNRDEKEWMTAINWELANSRKNKVNRCKNIERMMSFVRYYTNFPKFKLSDYPELKKFVSLLNLNNEQEVHYYITAADKLKMYNEAADLLIKRINLPVNRYEIDTLLANCQSLMLNNIQTLVIENRRRQLIDFLLKAKRAKEAQKWAEKFYGADADLKKIRSMSWMHIGMAQRLSGTRVFENKLKKAEPQAGTWFFYQKKYLYYIGRKDEKKAIKTLHEAIEKGKKLPNPELVVFASRELCRCYWRKGERKKALNLARKNNVYAIKNVHSGKKVMSKSIRYTGTQARMEAASQLMSILEQMKVPGWQGEWEKVARREFLDGQTFLLRNFLYKKRRIDRNYVMSANDKVFEVLCSEAYQKEHGFCDEAHAVRLAAVPYKSCFGDDFEDCLKQAMNDFEKYKRSKNDKPYGLSVQFYDAPHKAKRKALLAKYLIDRYPEAFKYRLADSIPVRNYDEGKKLLEEYWEKDKISPPKRRKALTALIKKASNQTEKSWCEKELAKLGYTKK